MTSGDRSLESVVVDEAARTADGDRRHRRSAEPLDCATLFPHFHWTADRVGDVYGTKPKVSYPPVNADEFFDVPQEDQQNGCITIGRIIPDKRIFPLVEVINWLCELGMRSHTPIVTYSLLKQPYSTSDERSIIAFSRETGYLCSNPFQSYIVYVIERPHLSESASAVTANDEL